MNEEPDVMDLSPSPWRAHGIVLGVLLTAFVVFVIGVWPQGDNLNANLGRIVVALYGVALSLFAILSTALIALFRHHGSPIITSYAIAIGLLGVLVIAFLGRA